MRLSGLAKSNAPAKSKAIQGRPVCRGTRQGTTPAVPLRLYLSQSSVNQRESIYISTSGGEGSLLAVRLLPPNGGKAGPGKGNHEALDQGERSPAALGLLAEGPGWRSHPS